MNANYRSIILAISLLFALAASTSAAPGDLDPSFGSGGIVITRGSGPNEVNVAWAMAIQPDGKIVVAGEGTLVPNNWDFTVVRYNPDGSLDSSFGDTGIVHTRLNSEYDGASSVAIQADGKIVVAGWSATDGFVLIRYNPDGSLDTSFGGTGIVITSGTGSANSVAIQADGRIVVAGMSVNGSTTGFVIARYNADGSLDTSFNGTGIVITPGGGARSVAIRSDGKIIAAGSSGSGSNAAFTLVRYNADGSLDTSFNGTGKVITSVGDAGSSVIDLALQTDGKIVAVGSSFGILNNFTTTDAAVVRYNPDGSLDTSFGGTGKILIITGIDYANSVAIQPNGKIVVAGSSTNDIGCEFAVVRLNPNGSLDASFNGTGKVITSIGGPYDYASSVAIQADGKIVVAGDTGPDENKDFVVVRYQGDGATPTPTCPNPIDCAGFFVRQHYLDFLNREPDPQGFSDWQAILNNCPQGSTQCDRIEVSSAFFRSPEFRERGYFPYRFYNVALGRKPDFAEFMPDLARVSGFLTEAEKEQARLNFIQDFMGRVEFTAIYNGLSNNAYVQRLFDTAGVTQVTVNGNVQTVQTMQQQMSLGKTRALVLREIVESQEVDQKFYVQAFVVMQYFGYLRRDPDALYLNWITQMQVDPNNYRQMVNGFVNSIEYRSRFGNP